MASEVAVLIGLSMPERRRYAGLFEQEATLHALQRWCPEGCYTGVRQGREAARRRVRDALSGVDPIRGRPLNSSPCAGMIFITAPSSRFPLGQSAM